MESASNASSTQAPDDTKTTPPYFFSTDGGRKSPQLLGAVKPSPIARSDVAADIATMISQLRTKWPQICYSIFTDPTIPTGFDLRWFWDEVDAYVLGREFLFNVICTIIKQNEDELFKYVQEWSNANAHCFYSFPYILYQGIDFVFNSQDRSLLGDEFLKRAQHIMRQAYERACLDSEAQATSQPNSRVTSNPGRSSLSRFSTTEDYRPPTTAKGGHRSSSNLARSVSTNTPAPNLTPSMRARGPNGVPPSHTMPPQYYYNGPNAQERTWVPSPHMGHIFQGQVPIATPYAQYPLGGPNQYYPHPHVNPPIPMQFHPSNIPRIPTQELINNMPAFSFGSGTLPFPEAPILHHPQDSTHSNASLHATQIPTPAFPFQQAISPNMPSRIQTGMQTSSIPEGQTWMGRNENSRRPSDASERGRRNSMTRGRGRGHFNNRGRRSSSSYGHQANTPQRSSNNGPPQRTLGPDTPPSQPPGLLETLPERRYNAMANGSQQKDPHENDKPSKNDSTNVVGNGAGTANVNNVVPSSKSIPPRGPTTSEYYRGGLTHPWIPNAGPAPRSKNGNIDTSRAIGPHLIGENVDDLYHLFVSGLSAYSEAKAKAAIDPYVAVREVRFKGAADQKSNAYVFFHSTADARRLLQQTNEGRLYVGPVEKSWCLYIETPRSRQHKEFASIQGSRRPQKILGLKQSSDQHSSISAPKSSVPPPAHLNVDNRESPSKKGRKKTASTQHKPVYTPQDARSQYPPHDQIQSPPRSLNIQSSQEPSSPKPSTWATVASSKPDDNQPKTKNESSEDIISSGEQKQPSSDAPEGDVLRQVQNHQNQTNDRTIGHPTRPTHLTPQENQSAQNIIARPAYDNLETNQLPSRSITQRKISKPVIPALPLKSPTNTKSISPSDESSRVGPKSPSPMKSTKSESESTVVEAQAAHGHSNPSKGAVHNSPQGEQLHDTIEQREKVPKIVKTMAVTQNEAGHAGSTLSLDSGTGMKGNVDNEQLSQTRQNAKTFKGKKKKKKASKTSASSGIVTPTPQSGIQLDADLSTIESKPVESNIQAPPEKAPRPQTPAESKEEEEEEPSTSKSNEPQRSSDDQEKSAKAVDLDPGWRLQYDQVMEDLTKVRPALQDDITKETLGLKQEILDVEEKILAGDRDTSRTTNKKKTWSRKRKRLFDEYKVLIEERLPMLAGKVQASAIDKTPSTRTETTSPSTSALSPQSESAIIRKAQAYMKETLGQIIPAERLSVARNENGSTWVVLPTDELDNPGGSDRAGPSSIHHEEDKSEDSGMDRLIKGEQTEQNPLPSISQTMHSSNEAEPASSDTEVAELSTKNVNGLGISGISVPSSAGGDETQSITTDGTTSENQQMHDRSPQSQGSSENRVQGTLRGGDARKESGQPSGPSKQKGPIAVSPSRQTTAMSYASVAKMPRQKGSAPLPAISDPAWSTKAKVLDSDGSSVGSTGPTPASGTASTMSRRASNATKSKDKATGDDWAVKHGEKVWGDQGFQQS